MSNRMTEEAKAAKVIIKMLDSCSFSESMFAYAIYQANDFIQARMLRLFIGVLEMWAEEYEEGNITESNADTLTTAKRILQDMAYWDDDSEGY